MDAKRIVAVAAVVVVAAGAITYLALREEPTPEGPATVDVQPPMPDPTAQTLTLILDKGASNEARVAAIRKIDRELTADEVEKLRALVKDRTQHSTLRNDVLALMVCQQLKPSGLGADLLAMWNDQDEDATWRDYCLQHMEAVYGFAADRELIEKTLVDTSKAGGRYAGTAMLSLERLGKRHPRLAANVEETARETVLAESRDNEAAVTALQVARAAGDESVLEKAREFAADKGLLVRLRMSAIGTLGDIGKKDDLALLEGLCSDPEKRVKRVARYNFGKLKKKYPE